MDSRRHANFSPPTPTRPPPAGPADLVVLLDCSGSMHQAVGARRKIDHLKDHLVRIWPDTRNCRLLAFNSSVWPLTGPMAVPEPHGGTDVARALEEARRSLPGRVLLISDGTPDDADAAIAVAASMICVIDVIYVGPDHDAEAYRFLRRLADVGGGGLRRHDLGGDQRRIETALRVALAAPAGRWA